MTDHSSESFPLAKYEAARAALEAASTVDEVKEIKDKADALRLYARQAKDTELIRRATEIRMRAERRMGEMLTEMRKRGQAQVRGRQPKDSTAEVNLKSLGISPTQGSRSIKLSALALSEFEQRVAAATTQAVKDIDSTAEERKAEKRERRAEHERKVAERILALPTKRYGVILADPPWQFNPWNDDTGSDRAARNHYAVQMLDQIKQRDVASISADDAALFLWATAPMLPQALEVLEHWGFNYRSHTVWLKDKVGTGYWFRATHELLLIGVKGDMPGPAPGTQWDSAWDAPVGAHSEKPAAAYELVEAYFPTVPKIELYARLAKDERRPGWDYFGAEAPTDLETAAEAAS